MAGGRRTLYWDTCIWLAWLRDEKRPDPSELQGIQEQVEKFHKGEIFIATSVLTLSELLNLSNELPAKKLRQFSMFFRRPDIIRIAADIRVAEITQKIRDYYFIQKSTDGLPTLELGDAIHLASAIHYKVDEFITLDSRSSKKPSRAKRGIIPLHGNVAGYRLKIYKPQPTQLQIPIPLSAGEAKAPIIVNNHNQAD